VLASVAIHGGMATPVSGWYGRRAARETLVEKRKSTTAGLFGHHEGEVQRINEWTLPKNETGLIVAYCT
jgi:hypothetical protein